MLGGLGVALVRHGDAANGAGPGSLAQLGDLGSLELVHLVADPRERPADQGEEGGELSEPVAGGGPAYPRVGQAEPLTEPVAKLRSGLAEESQCPDAAGELPDQPTGGTLAQPLEVTADLVCPRRGLEPKGDRRAPLPVGAAGHRRVPVALGQSEQQPLDGAEVTRED
jgi:hypothetical protein